MGPVETVMQQLADELAADGVPPAERNRIIARFLLEVELMPYGVD